MPFFNCPRLLEILEDPDRRLSSTKFCVLLGQILGCFVIARLAWYDKLEEGMFSLFLLYSGGLYGLGRYATVSEKNAEAKASQPPAVAVPVPVPAATSPTVNINMPNGSPAQIPGDANFNVEGDANVKTK